MSIEFTRDDDQMDVDKNMRHDALTSSIAKNQIEKGVRHQNLT